MIESRGLGGCRVRKAPLRIVPGLDGVRGVAVVAVLAFHAGLGWAGGGLLGVDMFFVLSGFLVTSLLLGEHSQTGTVRFRAFWARRARRLLPALFVLVIGVSAYAVWAGSGLPPSQLRGDALSTLGYVANWHFIVTGQNYFVRFGAASPLLHTWSLAVEEQFYLLWPIVLLLVLRRFGRRGVGWTAGCLAAASASASAALSLTGTQVSRIYFGTDTRAQAIMVGALVAALFPLGTDTGRFVGGAPEALVPNRHPWSRRAVGLVGLAGAIVLVVALHAVTGQGAMLYRGGFLLIALCTAAVVVLVVERPEALLSRALAWRPLRYVGRISYGLYLYHWPIFLVLDGTRTGLRGSSLLVTRLATTFVVAVASYHLVEQPLRSWRPQLGRSRRPTLASVAPLGAMAAAVVAVVAVLLVATVTPPTSAALPAGQRPPARFSGPAGLDSAHPERAVLVGDSLALTLGIGLARDDRAWGITVANHGAIGCDLDPATTVDVMGTVSPAAQGCPHWQAQWAKLVAQVRPDVVAVLLGRWESLDRIYQGRWTHVGQSVFDRHLQDELAQVIDIGSSHGARVVFLTLPFIAQTTEQPDGEPWDMNLPSRTDAYNADVRKAVALKKGRASVIDLNKILDPGGQYTSFIHGVRVRSSDNEHISVEGGEWLRPSVLPALVRFGLAHYESTHYVSA